VAFIPCLKAREFCLIYIKAIKTHGLTTRLVLTNGRYITGNKTFVIAK